MLVKVLFAVLVAAVTFNVMAEDKPLSFQVLSISDKLVEENKDIKIIVKDQKGGVFVQVRSGWSSVYPKTAKLIGDMMAAKGIKIATDPQQADVGLQFSPVYGFNMDDVESQADHFNTSKAGAAIGAILGGGIFGVVGMLGSDANKPVARSFMIAAAEKPTLSGRGNVEGENKRFVMPTIKYQASDTGFEASNMVFAAVVEDFINRHFIFDTPIPAAISASGAVAATSIEAASAVPVAVTASDVK